MSTARWLLVLLVAVALAGIGLVPLVRGRVPLAQVEAKPLPPDGVQRVSPPGELQAITIDGPTFTMGTGTVTTTAPAARAAAAPAAQAGIDPNDCVWALRLEGALTDGRLDKCDLTVLLRRQKDKWSAGIADAPTYNRVTHSVDASELVLQPVRAADTGPETVGRPQPAAAPMLRGVLKVTVMPDLWVPMDGQKHSYSIRLTVTPKEGRLTGSYSVEGREEVGVVTGKLQPSPDVENCQINLCLENLLTFGEDWTRRVDVTFERRAGKHKNLGARAMAVDNGQLPLLLDASQIKLDDNAVTGTLTLTAKRGGDEVDYDVTLKGTIVGEVLGGTYSGTVGDAKVKGRFRGYVSPVAKPTAPQAAETRPAAK